MYLFKYSNESFSKLIVSLQPLYQPNILLMSEFWIYFQIGLKHVLDIHAYDHVLFLIALAVPFSFKDWKRVVLLVTLFTVGHTMALLLSVLA